MKKLVDLVDNGPSKSQEKLIRRYAVNTARALVEAGSVVIDRIYNQTSTTKKILYVLPFVQASLM